MCLTEFSIKVRTPTDTAQNTEVPNALVRNVEMVALNALVAPAPELSVGSFLV